MEVPFHYLNVIGGQNSWYKLTKYPGDPKLLGQKDNKDFEEWSLRSNSSSGNTSYRFLRVGEDEGIEPLLKLNGKDITTGTVTQEAPTGSGIKPVFRLFANRYFIDAMIDQWMTSPL